MTVTFAELQILAAAYVDADVAAIEALLAGEQLNAKVQQDLIAAKEAAEAASTDIAAQEETGEQQ